ncbi:phosphopantetheine-binding protein [Acinetobacter sp. HY1485]|uniref:phosphopantetheine-binding protein n=1 Tax=Acinetobacter sp. HY1485 TaxID=2970918 RepID=UPI0022B94E2B|nr:phosphopantetheine-binding protein [Acinetobacter sp. HY1485]
MNLEQEIKQSIQQVLELENTEILPKDNLIEYGLHSLAIMRLVDIFEKQYQKKLSYTDFAMAPSIEDWIKLIEPQQDQAWFLTQLPSSSIALSQMQYAYWAGRQTSHTAAHLYMEFKGSHINVASLKSAYQELFKLHPMLNVSIKNGQQIIHQLRSASIKTHDLKNKTGEQATAFLQQLRWEMSHQQLAIEEGQVIDCQLTLLPNHEFVLHVDSDMIAIDPPSLLKLMQDLTQLYLGQRLDYPFEINYFDLQLNNSIQKEQDQKWWQNRLEQIFPIPDLPYIPEQVREDAHVVIRKAHCLDKKQTQFLQQLAKQHTTTVEAMCLSLFAQTIALWSSEPKFRLNFPFFANSAQTVGDFANMGLLNIELNPEDDFLTILRHVEHEVLSLRNHSEYTGVEVLRDLSKLHHQQEIAPIVFTSGLNQGKIFSKETQQTLGQPIWCISQGPKVDLDVQIAYLNEQLVINWDIRKNAFKAHVIENMFADYLHRIGQLIDKPQLIEQPLTYVINRPVQTPAYRVINKLGLDCPNEVIGELWHYKNNKWAQTADLAYFTENHQLHIFEEPRVYKNGYWIEAQQISKKLAAIPYIQKNKVFILEQKCVAVLVAQLNHILDYRPYLESSLIPDQSYWVTEEEFKALNYDNIQQFIKNRDSIESEQNAQYQQSALQKVVHLMMCQLIGVAPQQSELNMDFFDYGGDSLLATHFVAVLNRYFKGCDLSVVDIFSERTVNNLAILIEQNLPNRAQEIADVLIKVVEGKK